jgi:heme A synthase
VVIRKRRRGDRAVGIGTMVVNLLLVLQVAAGALDAIFNLPAGLSALHIALASLLWGAVVAVALLSLQVVGETSTAQHEAPPSDTVLPRARVAQS